MKFKYYLALSLFLAIFFQSNIVIGTIYLEIDNQQDEIYSYGYIEVFEVQNLVVGSTYTLMIANNTRNPQNHTWTAKSNIAHIYYKFDGSLIDRDNITLTQLQFILVNEDSNLVLDEAYLTIERVEDWLSWEGLIQFFIQAFIIFIAVIIFIVAINIFLKFVGR